MDIKNFLKNFDAKNTLVKNGFKTPDDDVTQDEHDNEEGNTVTCSCLKKRCGSEETGFAHFGERREVETEDIHVFKSVYWVCEDGAL
jgi:hypothetical protein